MYRPGGTAQKHSRWVFGLKKVDDMGSLRCPNSNVTKPPPHGPFGSKWHVPPKWLDSESKFWLKNATLFTVVRDPYARVVSSWNYLHRYPKVVNATAMNQWLEQTITKMNANRPVGDSLPKAAYFCLTLLDSSINPILQKNLSISRYSVI